MYMSKNSKKKIEADSQIVLDSIRRIIRTLRMSSKSSEKTLGLSAAQIFVLQKLAASNEPLSINELAAATLTHQSSVSVVVSKLVNRNLIERMVSENDSRSVGLKISKQGDYLLSKSPMSIQVRIIKGLEKLTDLERTGLVTGLQALILRSGMAEETPSMMFEEEDN